MKTVMKHYALELKWGLIFCMALLAWCTLERLLGLHDVNIALHMYATNGFVVVAIAIYVFAFRAIRTDKLRLQALFGYRQAFTSGVLISVVVAVLSPLLQLIINFIISPDFFTNMIAHSVQSGMATQEQAEAYFNLRSYMLQSSVGALVMGIVTSAVVAIFVRQK